MNTEQLLEELETLVETSNRIPMTTKRMVEEDEMMRIIDSIQESLPWNWKSLAALWLKRMLFWQMLKTSRRAHCTS